MKMILRKTILWLALNLFVFVAFSQAPIALSFSPADNSTGVSPNTVLSIQFDTPVRINNSNPSTIQYLYIYDEFGDYVARIRLTTAGVISFLGCSININKTTSADKLEITLENGTLSENTNYYVIITDQLFESASNGLKYAGISDETYWNFTTGALPVPPTISSQLPAPDALNISIGASISCDFNEGVVVTTSSGLYFKIVRYSDGMTHSIIDRSGVTINGTTMTVNSHLDFIEDTKYYITIDAGFVKSTLSGAEFAGITNKDTWAFTTEKIRVWKGSASTDITNALNWEENKAFVDGATVKVPSGKSYYPSLTGVASINDLIVETGGSFTVASTGNLTINGKLELKSATDNNADFVCLGTLTYDANKVYIHQNIELSTRNYYISSPVVGATQTSIGASNPMNVWDTSIGQYTLHPSSSAMDAAQGFILKSTQNLLFSGSMNTGDISKIIYRTSNNAGWNLVGNPYPCAIDWNNVIKSQEVVNSFWIYDNLTDKYAAYNSSLGGGANLIDGSKIPSNHSFWVKVKQEYPAPSTGLLTFKDNSKARSIGSYLKSIALDPEYPKLKIACKSGEINDEIVVGFAPEATTGFDTYDTEKYFSYNNSLTQPFMSVAGKKLCINSYPILDKELLVPVTLRVGSVGDYSIERISIENFEEQIQIYLVDQQENTTINLKDIASYPFSLSSTGDIANRFAIRFVGSINTGLEDQKYETDKMSLFVDGRDIFVNFADNKDALSLYLYSITGKQIYTKTIFGNDAKITVPTEGVFLLKVSKGKEIITKKVLIK